MDSVTEDGTEGHTVNQGKRMGRRHKSDEKTRRKKGHIKVKNGAKKKQLCKN